MKRYIFLIIISCISLGLLWMPNCGKSRGTGEADLEIAKKLVQTFNELPGLTFKGEPVNIQVEPSEKKRYIITLKDTITTVDTSSCQDLNLGLPFKDMLIPVEMAEIVFKYGPGEKYLELISCQGISFEWDFSKLVKIPGKNVKKPGLSQMVLKTSVGNANFKNYDISPVLEAKEKKLMELLSELLVKNQSLEYTLDNLRYELDFTEKQKKMSLLIETEKLEGFQRGLSEIFLSIYKKEDKAPDLANVLKQGTALIDLGMTFSSLKVTVKENEKEMGGGAIDNMFLSYFFKPDKTNSLFIYGFDWDMTEMKLSNPANREIEMIGKIHRMGMKFSLENLSAAFVQAYLNLIKKNIEMSTSLDKEKLRQQQMTMGFTIASEFMKSKPVIKCSLSPLKHYFGELEADVFFQFINLMAPPVGKAKASIPNINEIIDKIQEEKSLSQKTREGLLTLVKKYVQVDENGNGSLTFETREDQPGKFFLNGQPIK